MTASENGEAEVAMPCSNYDAPPSNALVLLDVTGDLARKKSFPAAHSE